MIIRPLSRAPHSFIADLSVVTALAAALYGLVKVGRHWQAPLQPTVEIDLSLWALPGYTLLSLLRGFVAYGLSLSFAVAYGYAAARRPRAERILLPLLDVLQSIPVLGFLPGAVLVLIRLFPHSNTGLELACILMLFTSQVWNLAFSFYSSLQTIPSELQEAAAIYQFTWWQRFRRVELAAAAVGLAWNSMMSMAGGWFFLMVCEAFTLGSHDFRLPGLGAYMSEALAHHNAPATLAGIAAMVLMILIVDTCVWRPTIAYAKKFRLEETAGMDEGQQPVINWVKRSWLLHVALPGLLHPVSEWLSKPPPRQPPARPAQARSGPAPRIIGTIVMGVAGAGMLWAAWHLVRLFGNLPLREWMHLTIGALLTTARVTAAVALGSCWTVPVGIWIGRSERWCRRLQPVVQVAASFPAPMLYPLILLALHQLGVGLGVGAVLLMMLGTQWYILFNVIAGASAVPEDLKLAAGAYQFTSWQLWRVLWWPAVFPYLVTGWVTAAGGAWNASIVAEYIARGTDVVSTSGLGALISTAASQGRYALLAASILAMSITVILTNRYCWKPLYRLAQTRYAA